MEEVKFKMGKYEDLIKLFNDGKLNNDTLYISNMENEENNKKGEK